MPPKPASVKYNPCRGFRYIGCGRDGNADLRLAERRRVIGAIAAHPYCMPALLEGFDKIILAFRQNACEYREIFRLDALGKFSGRANRPGQPNVMSDDCRRGRSIPRHHDCGHTECM